MRPITEPYCFSMLAPRVRRGGTIRPENCSKLWAKDLLRMIARQHRLIERHAVQADAIAAGAMPLAAASVLKSSSHA